MSLPDVDAVSEFPNESTVVESDQVSGSAVATDRYVARALTGASSSGMRVGSGRSST